MISLPLIIVLILAVVLAVVIWKFSNSKFSGHGIDVVTGDGEGYDEPKFDMTEEKSDIAEESDVVDDEEKNNSQRTKLKKLKSSVEDECIKSIVENPKDINAYLRLSVFYLQRQKWNDAKEVLLEAKKIDDNNDKVFNNLGMVWYKLKRYNNAVSAFEEAIKLNDKIAHRYVNLGLCYYALGENNKASKKFSKAVALDPEHREYQDLLAEAKSMLV